MADNIDLTKMYILKSAIDKNAYLMTTKISGFFGTNSIGLECH
jgi:hypothetical protein